MADLDAELLALAGDTSEEDSGQDIGNQRAVASPKSPPGGSSKKPRARRAAAREPSDDEGEASEVSVAMSASSAGSAASDASEALFPIENKFYTEKDRAEIMALPEIERESILAERAQILERKQQDNILKRLYKGYKTAEDKAAKKRKSGDGAREDGERKSSRQRTTLAGRKVGEASASLEAYKAQREKKGQQEDQRRADLAAGKKARRRSASYDSDAAADAESDVDWDDGRAARELEAKAQAPAELADYRRVQIGRMNFSRVCFYPGFEETMKDCYVRVSVGPDKATGETIYRMAKIENIKEDDSYAIEAANGSKFITNQHVVVSLGRSKRDWPFLFCSMGPITETELNYYRNQVQHDGFSLPSKAFLENKTNAINALINRTFTEAELQQKLKRSGVLQQKQSAIERQTLLVRRRDAEAVGDEAALATIDAQLRNLSGPKLAFGTSLQASSVPSAASITAKDMKSQQERLAELNRQNRKLNSENVRRAELRQMREHAAHRAAVQRGEATADRFARVKVRPTTHFDVHAAPAASGAGNSTKAAANAKPANADDEGDDREEFVVQLPHATFDWAQYDMLAAWNPARVDDEGNRTYTFRRRPCRDALVATFDLGLDDVLSSALAATTANGA